MLDMVFVCLKDMMCFGRWQSVICWLQYDNGVAEKNPEEFGIERIGE